MKRSIDMPQRAANILPPLPFLSSEKKKANFPLPSGI